MASTKILLLVDSYVNVHDNGHVVWAVAADMGPPEGRPRGTLHSHGQAGSLDDAEALGQAGG